MRRPKIGDNGWWMCDDDSPAYMMVVCVGMSPKKQCFHFRCWSSGTEGKLYKFRLNALPARSLEAGIRQYQLRLMANSRITKDTIDGIVKKIVAAEGTLVRAQLRECEAFKGLWTIG